MGWSLGYLPVRDPQSIDDFLLAVGKALYIASCYEKKCLWVLRIAKLGDRYAANPNLDDFHRFAQVLKDKPLGPTLRELDARSEVADHELQRLIEGERRGITSPMKPPLSVTCRTLVLGSSAKRLESLRR